MIYCVVPRPLVDELYPKLAQYYENESNVTVIVDRREHDRRTRRSTAAGARSSAPQRRVLRDRRRARVPGDLPPLARV
jgi:hypothetical protein